MLEDIEARTSIIWIIGEYAEQIDNINELMQPYIDSFLFEHINIQLQILTACVKIFLKKPDTSEELITNILRISTEETTNPDIRDRGFI